MKNPVMFEEDKGAVGSNSMPVTLNKIKELGGYDCHDYDPVGGLRGSHCSKGTREPCSLAEWNLHE